MAPAPIAAELGKLAAKTLASLSSDEAKQALRAITKVGTGGVGLLPGLGGFGLGLALGAGLGVLLAPRSGSETRARLRSAVTRRLEALRPSRVGRPSAATADVADAHR